MTQGWRHYPYARLCGFVDGDTCEVEVDHGFSMYHHIWVRLYGVSCPEVVGVEKPRGLAALRAARELMVLSSTAISTAGEGVACQLWTWKASFNRYVGRVVLCDAVDVAREIISMGYGHAWDGKTERRPFDAVEFPLPTTPDDEARTYDHMLARDFTAKGGTP